MAESSDKLYRVEYAKSGRASCKKCSESIPKDSLRMAIMVQSPMFDGKVPHWYHFSCFWKVGHAIRHPDVEVDGFSELRWDDQQKVKKTAEAGGVTGKGQDGVGSKAEKTLGDFAAEYAKSNRSTCKGCMEKIEKGHVRLSKKMLDPEKPQLGMIDRWYHPNCFVQNREELGFRPEYSASQLKGFNLLTAEDKESLKKQLPGIKSEGKRKGDEVDGVDGVAKKKSKKEKDKESKLEKALKAQNDLIWNIKDELKKVCSTNDLKELLIFNKQQVPSGESAILDRVADGMVFGALLPCEECSGQLVFKSDAYYCTGDVTAWTKCMVKTQTPNRKEWVTPKEFREIAYLKKLKIKKQDRIFPPEASAPVATAPPPPAASAPTAVNSSAPPDKPLSNMKILTLGKLSRNKDEVKAAIEKLGGKLTGTASKASLCVSTKKEVDKMSKKMEEVKEANVRVVSEDFLQDVSASTKSLQELLCTHILSPWGAEMKAEVKAEPVEAVAPRGKSGGALPKKSKGPIREEGANKSEKRMKLTLKGGAAVDPDSGLEHSAHVLEKGGKVFSATLGLVDIVKGTNSYYKLQLLEDDKESRYWIFRSWGRVGTVIGSNKLEQMPSKEDAIDHFMKLYEEKTGNAWHSKNFTKYPKKFYPLEIDYGQDEEAVKKLTVNPGTKSKLPKSVQELIKMIFDVESMKKAMVEYEIDLQKMPLGKLSKRQIQAAYAILSEVQQAVSQGSSDSQILDLSNRFYTLIPHDFGMKKPPLLNNADSVQAKVEMLDNLLDIEVAYSLLRGGSDDSSKDPIDVNYEKLKTDIKVVDRDSEEAETIRKYVKNTHATTHNAYDLEVIDIFKIEREGESQRYKPFKQLHNRRLLWHGSRTTNFAGILSQGLRIAPPEAPVTGYMFGKGIYFADMVSKSANYCHTSQGDPIGLILLGEVALGNMYELKHASHISKLPKGKHSVKGLGKTTPDPPRDCSFPSSLAGPPAFLPFFPARPPPPYPAGPLPAGIIWSPAMDAPSAGYAFEYLIETLNDSSHKKFFNVPRLGGTKYDVLPYSIRVLLEAAVRNCDGFLMKKEDVMNILDWKTKQSNVEVPFFPGRVLLQDFTGIPAMVDFAAMREAVKTLGGDPKKVHPACPTDLTVDHSLQIDFNKCAIQNAPNPGGGDLQKAGKLSPLRVQPKKLPCRGQTACRGSCDSGDLGRNSGKFSSQIENTPILCPFHLQPVPEPETVLKNQEVEFGRNRERLQFFKWSSRVFKNVAVIPPGTGMAHQVNLEYLSRVVFEEKDLLFPDSVVGTDSHITMVNGLGILGWGVGGIETEAVMLGLPVSLTLPEVVGCELTGSSNPFVTSIDVVLGITKHLRQIGVAGKFVEFFGSGVSQLSIVDRTTIANMCPEYGAILSFFPVDNVTLKHLEYTGFNKAKLKSMETYLKAVKLFRNDQDNSGEPEYSQVIQINLNSIVPSVSGPKRPQDRVAVTDMKSDFQACLNEKVGFKGFQIAAEKQNDTVSIHYEGSEYKLSHGSVVIAAVISCTNNCNPSVMLAAGLLAKKAVEAGLRVKPYIRTSLSPGSGMVTHYLSSSGVLPYLSKLGFEIVGYGCSTCVGNTAPLSEAVLNAVKQGDLVTCGVLSGNKNFEGRLCDCVRANYLASPPLVVAYAIAGTVNIDFRTEPLGTDPTGKNIYLHDIWPSREEVHQIEEEHVVLSMFKALKEKIEMGNKRWNSLEAPDSVLFPWDLKSTYIRCPSFFDKLTKEPVALQPIENAHVLLYLGDSVTTDHISPAGSIARSSAAAKYLTNRGLTPREFNSYGARRGNDAVMTRGTFANIKLFNKFIGKPAPKTIHFPSGQTLDVFEAAELYQKEGIPLIILAGKKYGSGNSRDWAAKGPYLLGVKAVLAESYEKIHKDHLIGIGIAPLQFLPGENADSLGLSGRETFSLTFPEELSPGVTLNIKTSTGKIFSVIASFENDVEIILYKHGGLLNFVARKFS